MNWEDFIRQQQEQDYFRSLQAYLRSEYERCTVYPPYDEIYTAFSLTPADEIKCVILGQDPYHGAGQAHGLAFSVKPEVAVPKSLNNIYKELNDEFGYPVPGSGYLEKWARQGVLMLNTVLTVRAGEAGSHRGRGWETFTDNVIREINKFDRPVVFMLWGNPAAAKEKLLDNPKHLILKAAHPSPLSAYRGFFGCGHFKKCNEYLIKNGIDPIDWKIDDDDRQMRFI